MYFLFLGTTVEMQVRNIREKYTKFCEQENRNLINLGINNVKVYSLHSYCEILIRK